MRVLAVDFGGVKDPAAAALLETDGRRHHVTGLYRRFGDFSRFADDVIGSARPEAVVLDGTGWQAEEPLPRLAGTLRLANVPLYVLKVVRNSRDPGQRGAFVFVPKIRLVLAAQRAIEERRLTVDRHLELAPVLAAEVRGFREKVRPVDGLKVYEHATRRLHDDLFASVSMGVWFSEHQHGAAPQHLWRPYV